MALKAFGFTSNSQHVQRFSNRNLLVQIARGITRRETYIQDLGETTLIVCKNASLQTITDVIYLSE